jgi:hypothetical protein
MTESEADLLWRATITWCRRRRLATQQHRYPCAQQFPHQLAGMCSVAGHVVGKLYGLRPITRHDAHFNWWRVTRKAPAIHRKPVPFRELEQYRGIAAGCHHASCWGVWFKPEFLQVLAAFHTDDTISSVQQVGRSAVGIEHLGRRWKALDLPTSCLTTVAIARGADDRSAHGLEDNATAGASGGKSL